MFSIEIDTPVGRIAIVEQDEHIIRVTWSGTANAGSTPLLQEAARQLRGYFDGEIKDFELPLAPVGGEFQQRVCATMQRIPFGETRTYGEIAADLGSMPQPIGQACAANSIPIIIPCHRVLAANGLGGFSGDGGIETKITLLKHEGAFPYLL